MGFRVMDKTQGKHGKVLREDPAEVLGFLQTPHGKLVRVICVGGDGGKLLCRLEKTSEDDYGILNVIGNG